jgi:ubiquinone/menaquinone biosynthesis C-methylase UbiE
MTNTSGDAAKAAVRQQYGAVGDAYVKSTGHATGSDLERMVVLAQPAATDEMLDIATGGGHVARVFVPHVASIVASDLTPEILEHAGKAFADWGFDNVTTAVADAENLPFGDASFDIVTCRIAPHHFPDPAAFVREVARVLRPGGRFLLVDSTVPEGEDGEFFNRFEKLRDPSHVRSLTIAEWTALLWNAGFSVDAVESFTKRHDFADWTSRSRTSDSDRAELARMLITAPESRQKAFGVEIDSGNASVVSGFTDTKTLYVTLLILSGMSSLCCPTDARVVRPSRGFILRPQPKDPRAKHLSQGFGASLGAAASPGDSSLTLRMKEFGG